MFFCRKKNVCNFLYDWALSVDREWLVGVVLKKFRIPIKAQQWLHLMPQSFISSSGNNALLFHRGRAAVPKNKTIVLKGDNGALYGRDCKTLSEN